MRKFISVLLVALMIVCLCACGANNSATQSTDNTNTTPDENTSKEQTAPIPSSETTPETKQATNAIETAETIPSFIVARGTPEGCVYDADFATISVESWDLGTSQNPLSQEDALCIKYHVKNKTEETIALEGIFNVFVYIDGVQRESFISDFYGDMSSFQVFPDTKLRPDAETDVYMCYACDLTLPHHVDIDIGNRLERVPDSDFFYANEDIIGSLAFEIDE
jgi:hypothetical protein